ncbi:MAG: hypothetical protein KatS3mg115_0502 [Candidatus Poribacteria bacterium]|nr:MAG: hypothetical protein KatS3mg115_0502 [Candidatus Poribacteria bacterium]
MAEEQLRILAFGAHPDDCDIKVGGVCDSLGPAGAPGAFCLGDQRRRWSPQDGRWPAWRDAVLKRPNGPARWPESNTSAWTITTAS